MNPMSGQGATNGGVKALAWIGGLLATVAAVIIGSVLTVFAVTTVVVLAVMTSATLAFVALANRAGRKARARAADDGIIEARKVGGHHWVAYGWNERR